MSDDQLLARITTDARVMAGKPVIRGTRLPVAHVVQLLGEGASVAEILDEYRGLTADDVRACLLYAGRALDSKPAASTKVAVAAAG